jgi:hypothetical protein
VLGRKRCSTSMICHTAQTRVTEVVSVGGRTQQTRRLATQLLLREVYRFQGESARAEAVQHNMPHGTHRTASAWVHGGKHWIGCVLTVLSLFFKFLMRHPLEDPEGLAYSEALFWRALSFRAFDCKSDQRAPLYIAVNRSTMSKTPRKDMHDRKKDKLGELL